MVLNRDQRASKGEGRTIKEDELICLASVSSSRRQLNSRAGGERELGPSLGKAGQASARVTVSDITASGRKTAREDQKSSN